KAGVGQAEAGGGPGLALPLFSLSFLLPLDIVRSDIALDKQKGCKIAQHPDIMLELQREKAAQMHLVLLKEQFSNTYSNLTLTARSLDKLYNFADCSGLHLIFALNALRRNPNNSWNSSNALSLLKYSASKKYNISWELGNEPNNYRTLMGRSVNGSQLGKDYIQLRSLLQLIRTYSRAMVPRGPGQHPGTWSLSCYYIDSRVAKVTDFLKTRLLDTLSDQIRKIQKVVNVYTPGKRIWLEGVGASSTGAMTNLSDSFAAGFLWLNTLGMLAHQGIDVVMRHSFFDHGHNHLVDQNFNPLPDYWVSLLYKRLVGPKVLAVHVAGLQRKPRPGRVIRDKLRIYAHSYVRGSITLFIINLHRSRKKIKLAGTLRDKTVHQYLLHSDCCPFLPSVCPRPCESAPHFHATLGEDELPGVRCKLPACPFHVAPGWWARGTRTAWGGRLGAGARHRRAEDVNQWLDGAAKVSLVWKSRQTSVPSERGSRGGDAREGGTLSWRCQERLDECWVGDPGAAIPMRCCGVSWAPGLCCLHPLVCSVWVLGGGVKPPMRHWLCCG
uniref:Heparanase 2 (inactive) n=1 Tax=Crocodylus porosus TaxID=8502 RepID=A0A7M4F579_CROPO